MKKKQHNMDTGLSQYGYSKSMMEKLLQEELILRENFN